MCTIDETRHGHYCPVSHGSLPVADPHVLDLHHDNTNIPAGHEVRRPTLGRVIIPLDSPSIGPITIQLPSCACPAVAARVLAEELYALLVRVILEVLVAEELLLLGAGPGYAGCTPYGGAYAGDLGGVEVEQEGG